MSATDVLTALSILSGLLIGVLGVRTQRNIAEKQKEIEQIRTDRETAREQTKHDMDALTDQLRDQTTVAMQSQANADRFKDDRDHWRSIADDRADELRASQREVDRVNAELRDCHHENEWLRTHSGK